MFGKLDTLALGDFIAEERADDHLFIFAHVPKTAGSSFGNELARARKPYRNIHIDYNDANVPLPQQMDHAVQRFISELSTRKFLSCSGHLQTKHVDMITQFYPTSKLISFVRHPIARFISDYRYARTPAHPPYRDAIARFPTFDAYLNGPGLNKMFRQLTGDVDMDITEGLELIDNRYAFIGAVEMYEMSFNIIFRLFGQDRLPMLRMRQTEATSDNVVELTPELAARIEERNAKDLALYEHVHRRLTAKYAEWSRTAPAPEAEAAQTSAAAGG